MKPRGAFLLLIGLIAVLLTSRVVTRYLAPAPRSARLQLAAADPIPGPPFRVPFQAPTAQPARKQDPAKNRSKPAADGPQVTHKPQQPKAGQPVSITVDFKDHPAPSGQLLLEYQIVDPGKYIGLHDAAFEKQWESMPMTAKSGATDDKASNRLFTAQMPGALQKHRRFIRYRIRAVSDRKLVAPDPNDPQPNYAYFVYDGVPPWKGAVNPNASETKLQQPVTFSSESLQRVPVYHFISSKSAVERVTWTEGDRFGNGERNAYKYTGTMVYDGIVYDHVGFRARGGSWRHAMGKNMWKFNFLPGHRFEARDFYGQRYNTKWDKLNLGACIQQGDYGMRGEQGMFEAVGFRLFNLAGMEAARTHWVHFRIIDQPDECPRDQYGGDFWGLYLAVENVDEHFLKEHELPSGNLYKMEFGAKTAFNGDPTVTDQSDIRQFLSATLRQRQNDAWWLANVDLPRYYNYRSIIECIHHYDVDAGKNYFYYRNPQSQLWVTIPWDIDLTWGDSMYGAGQEPFYRSGILFKSPFKQQYQERLAEIRDLLFNPEQIGTLIDEHASMIFDPSGRPSLADADRAKWDYNPIMASSYVMEMKAGQGRYYFGNPHNTFRSMISQMKSYAARRATWIDRQLLSDYRPPAALKIAPPSASDFSAPGLALRVQAPPPGPVRSCRWRLAEVTDTNSPAFNPREPWKYEIQELWSEELQDPKAPAAVPTKLLNPGHTYRVRARWQDPGGAWSRWSAPAQVTVPKQGTGNHP